MNEQDNSAADDGRPHELPTNHPAINSSPDVKRAWSMLIAFISSHCMPHMNIKQNHFPLMSVGMKPPT